MKRGDGASRARPSNPGPLASVILLGDLDALIRDAQETETRERLRRVGLSLDGLPRLLSTRARLVESIDRRWATAYQRAHQRYGRAVAAVRERVCVGCYVTLPTTARPRAGDRLDICESCGRILYWT